MNRRCPLPGARVLAALVLAALAVTSCREHHSGTRRAGPMRDAGDPLGQRVFRPTPGVVRAVPPHNIQATGVGPYALGAELRDVLAMLPHGPRVELLEIEGLVDYSLVRAEEGRLVVGVGAGGRVTFITVLDPEIAKTDGGLGVGTSVDKLVAGLGPVRDPDNGVRDPRLLGLEHLPNARVVIDDGRAAAIVVGGPAAARTGDGRDGPGTDALSGGDQGPAQVNKVRAVVAAMDAGPGADDDPGASVCVGAAEALAGAEVAETAKVDPDSARIHYGCFTGASPEAVVEGKNTLVLVAGEPGHLKRVVSLAMPGLVFAGAVDVDGDGRQEVVAVMERRSRELLVERVEVLRGEGGRLVPVGADDVYRMTSSAAAWVGAKLRDVDFAVEAEVRGGGLEVGGLYLNEVGGAVKNAVPLLPQTVAVKGRRHAQGTSAPRLIEVSGSGSGSGASAGGKHGETARSGATHRSDAGARGHASRADAGPAGRGRDAGAGTTARGTAGEVVAPAVVAPSHKAAGPADPAAPSM